MRLGRAASYRRAGMTTGISRRGLFGLGLAQVRDRFDAAPQAAPPRPEEPLPQWPADPSPLWRAVGEELVALAAPLPGERVLAHGVDAPGATGFSGDPAATGLPGGAFDVVLSAFGPQVTPTGRAALAELSRLVAPGGRLALVVWSDGPVAQLLRAADRHEPLPRGLPSPARWGSDERLRQDLDRFLGEAAFHRRSVTLEFASPEDALTELCAAVPPLAATRPGTRAALLPLLEWHLTAGRLEVPYLVAVVRSRTSAS